jgi:6-phosphogluconolactonase
MSTTWFCGAIGECLSAYSIDIETAHLRRKSSVQLPAWVMYVWPHPDKPLLYVVSSDGGPSGKAGELHHASVLRFDVDSGAMTVACAPRVLPGRPIHCSLDASGRYLLTAYNDPSAITVHPLDDDGAIGEALAQAADVDAGVFAHQVMTTPSNCCAILVTRGNDASEAEGSHKPEQPGALKVFAFNDGTLAPRACIAPGGGYGFGPRHVDFHPNQRWVYVCVERKNQLQMFELDADDNLAAQATFSADSLRQRRTNTLGPQLAGAVHVHPNGHFVVQSNRTSRLLEDDTWPVSQGGENTLVVYAIDPDSGAPTPIQHVDTGSIHVRTFSFHPSGRLLIAATIAPVPVRTAISVCCPQRCLFIASAMMADSALHAPMKSIRVAQ